MNERNIRTWMLLGDERVRRLQSSHVAVFGLGGVGSWCAEALARSGVGRLTLVDSDTVSQSNLNRQLCALTSTLGKPNAEVVRARLLPDSDSTARCMKRTVRRGQNTPNGCSPPPIFAQFPQAKVHAQERACRSRTRRETAPFAA